MKILAEQLEKKNEESHRTTRDVGITIGLHLWALLEVNDEFIAMGLKWTYVEVLRGSN